MFLATKLFWIKWIPLVLTAAFGLIFLADRLEWISMEDDPALTGLVIVVGIGLFASVAFWIGSAMTLACPKCGRLVGSRFDVRICRQCGHRL